MSDGLVFAAPWWLVVATVALVIGALPRARSPRGYWPIVLIPLSLFAASSPTAAGSFVIATVAGVAAVVFAVRAYASQVEIGAGRRRVLQVLRSIACIAVLAIVAEPSWVWRVAETERPVLAVVIDDSKSMGFVDGAATASQPGRTRAQRVADAVAAASKNAGMLNERYEVRVVRALPKPGVSTGSWVVEPVAGVTNLVPALQLARAQRTASGRIPAGVVLISDGAENVSSARELVAAASEVSRGEVPLFAVGVGPNDDDSGGLELDPLDLPRRVGLRERIEVPLTGRAAARADHTAQLATGWRSKFSPPVRISTSPEQPRFRQTVEITPLALGVHRFDAQLSYVPSIGTLAEQSALVEVVADRTRVLIVERVPRQEIGFLTRALGGDANLEVEVLFLNAAGGAAGERIAWDRFDVVILGNVGRALGGEDGKALIARIIDQGVGLFIVGNADAIERPGTNDDRSRRVALAEIVPLPEELAGDSVGAVVSGAGAAHEILRDVLRPDEKLLGNLPVRRVFADVAPTATILVEGPNSQPMLIAGQQGAGRVLAATWDATWPMALASDAGPERHRRFWRQAVAWLANRPPSAWVVTDRLRYVEAMLRGGEQRVLIRAGVAGDGVDSDHYDVRLRIRRAGSNESQDVALVRSGAEWTATLPDSLNRFDQAGGAHLLELMAQPRGVSTDAAARTPRVGGRDGDKTLTATTEFIVDDRDLEEITPAANLRLMNELAGAAVSAGGGYWPIDRLPELLAKIAERDQRVRIEHAERFGVVDRWPWGLFAIALAALAIEWTMRRRANLV